MSIDRVGESERIGSAAPRATQSPSWQHREEATIDPLQYQAWCDDKLAAMTAEPAVVQQTAADGVSGTATALPHAGAIQASFGHHDISGVQAHVGGAAATASDAMGAQAYATGNSVAFAARPDLRLAAHEAAHVVQQRGGVQLKGGVGQSGDVYEQHTDAVADKVVAGESAAPLLDVYAGGRGGGASGGGGGAVQRFDAGSGGHQGIEREVGGLKPDQGLGNEKNLGKPEPKHGTREQGVNAIYSGNYMQDFSQMHAPFVHDKLKDLPTHPADPKDKSTIGDAGSQKLTDSIIRALAILDVGPTLADTVVKNNMQSYQPEQHVDQPQGYAADTDSLVHDKRKDGPLRVGKRTVEGTTPQPDPDRDRDLAGSAAPGRQMENTELFKVGDAGLQNHIYNSAEWCKNHWLEAAAKGPTDEGRFHVGAGLHVIEDYFSHSNFIEVGLNSFIAQALKTPSKQTANVKQFTSEVMKDQKSGVHSMQKLGGQSTVVDTLFDKQGPKGKRQAVTTGSVSSIDMRGSIGHILAPKAPLLEGAINGSIDKIFHLVLTKPDKVGSWAQLKQVAGEDRPMAAVLALGDGVDAAGMKLPVPTGINLTMDSVAGIPILYPKGFSLVMSDQPVTQAVGSYIGFVKSAKGAIQDIQRTIAVIKSLLFSFTALTALLENLVTSIEKLIEDEVNKLKDQVKNQLSLGIVQLIDSLTGFDAVDGKKRTIHDAMQGLTGKIEDFEQQTSLEARLLPGGDLAKRTKDELAAIVGPVKPGPNGGWVIDGADTALAPSHSEISKDHAAHDEDDKAHGGHDDPPRPHHKNEGELLHPGQHQQAEHDISKGSIFGGLARALAKEADRHVLRQVEIVWASRGSLYGDGQGLDTSKMEVGHDAVGKEAATRATAEEKRAKKDGYQFAQSNGKNADAMTKPGVRDLMNLVDLILAHPDDSTWWKTVTQTYVDANGPEVAQHIRERNAVRGNRRRIKP